MMYIWIACVISFLAFIIHTFIGDKEIRMIRPKLGIDATLVEKWMMARAGWHWVSFDLLLISGILLAICLTEPVSWTPWFLIALGCCILALGCIWLAVIAFSERLPKKYINLGQWLLLWLIGLLVIIGGNTLDVNDQKNAVTSAVEAYKNTYSERKDFQKFLSFYDKEIVLEDMIGGFRIEGKEAFKEFFNWEDPRFKMKDDVALVIHDQVMEGKKVMLTGHFTPFIWDGEDIESMQFTTQLDFNDNGKIIRHVDWINYPDNLLPTSARKNSNEWIPMNMK